MTTSQLTVLESVPRDEMMVNPARLAAVLEEPGESGIVGQSTLITSLALSIGLCILAALWWAATH